MSFLKTTAIQHLNGSSPAINLDANGRVGLGTSNPLQKLSVTESMSITNSAGIQYLMMGNQDSGGTNKPSIIRAANGGTEIGYGSSWSGTGGSFTTSMFVDGSGRITKPYQPFFLARNGDESGDGISTNPFRFSSVIYNVGNHFVTSGTGAYTRFVAPISGVYAFTTNPAYKQTGVDYVCRAAVNGSVFTDLVRLIGAPNSHSGGCYAFNIYLNANDYVSLSSEGSTYHRNNGGVPNWFSGVLLG